MGNAFTASGYPVPSPELALAGYNSTYTEGSYSASSFAGLNVANAHLQATPTADTSSIVVTPGANEKVIITGVVATSTVTAAATPTIGTLAEEGSTTDLVIYQASGYSQFYASNLNLPLGKGKKLIHYRVQGDTGGSVTTDLNSVTITYKVVPA